MENLVDSMDLGYAGQIMWASLQSSGLFSDDILAAVRANVFDPNGPVQRLQRACLSSAQAAIALLLPLLAPLTDLLHRAAAALPPEAAAMAAAFAGLVLVLLVVRMVHRVVMWWTRLLARLMLWGVVVALAAVAYQRGAAACARDVFYVAGKVVGYAAVVKDIWLAEYQRWEEQAKASQTASAAR